MTPRIRTACSIGLSAATTLACLVYGLAIPTIFLVSLVVTLAARVVIALTLDPEDLL